MIKAVFFDVDGTLLDPISHQMPDSTKKAIQILRQKGYRCAIASGRDLDNIQQNSQLCACLFDGYVLANGMSVYDDTNICLQRHTFPTAVVSALLAFAQQHGYTLIFESENDLYCANTVNAYVDIANAYYQERTPHCHPWQQEPIQKITCFAPMETDFSMLNQQLPIRVLPTPTPSFDVTLASVSKLRGIETLMEHWGYPSHAFLCFGDQDNDIEMIEGAEIGVAVKDPLGSLRLQKLADDTCPSAAENGIYLYLSTHGYL